MNINNLLKLIKQLQDDIDYYESYKRNLIQYIIQRSCFLCKDRFTPEQMLSIQNELMSINTKIYKLKYEKQIQRAIEKGIS
jgi:hypothetical protein